MCLLQAAPCSRVDAFPWQPLPRLLPAQGGPVGPWLGCSSPAPSRGRGGGACSRWLVLWGILLGDSLTLLRLSACGAVGWSLQPPLVAHTHAHTHTPQTRLGGKLWAAFGALLKPREGAHSALAGLLSARPNLSPHNPNFPANLSLPALAVRGRRWRKAARASSLPARSWARCDLCPLAHGCSAPGLLHPCLTRISLSLRAPARSAQPR